VGRPRIGTTLEDSYRQIQELGDATGNSDAADALVRGDAGRDRIEIVAPRPVPPEPLSVYHELDPTLYSLDSTTLIGELYSLLGLRNIADAAEGNAGGYPQLNAEFIVSADPDLIFLADTKCCAETAETVAARPGWDAITAVANGNVFEMDDDIASRWGPRMVDYLRTSRRRRHPGAGLSGRAHDGPGERGARPGGSSWARSFLVVAMLVGASIGPAGPAAWRVPLALLDRLPLISVDSGVSEAEWNIIWKIRMPRVVLGGLVGAMLSVAGASYQGVFRNPLVDPYLLGTAAGAGSGCHARAHDGP
jgi:hypothetical protein